MRIGFYTYSYVDRLGLEPAAVLQEVAAAGYESLDLSATWREDEDPADFPPARRAEIARCAADLGLTIDALVTHLPLIESLVEGRPINLPGAVDLAVELKASIVTFHIGAGDPAAGDRGLGRARDYLRECAAYAGARGIRLALDGVFPRFAVCTPRAVREFLEAVGSPFLGHNFDPCYLALSGFDPAAAARELAPWIVHAHVKDYAGHYPAFEHRIPGQGALDHHRWMAALLAIGFDGAAAVECFPDHPLEAACRVGFSTLAAARRRVRRAELA